MKYIITERQYRLLSEQEEEILTIPYAHFQGDWDMLQVFLKRRKNPPYRISGDLNLLRTQIKSLGYLQSVEGDLYLSKTPIENLGNLESVDGSLNLKETPIKSLGNLKSVGGDLTLQGSTIKSLGNLESVGGNFCKYRF